MKNTFLLTIAAFGIFALLAGCTKTTAGTNNTATTTTQNTTATTNTAAPKTEEPKVILKPGDVSPDKTVKVVELVDSVAADKDAWKGKEVSLAGFVSATATSGKNETLTLTSEQMATNKRNVSCTFQGGKLDELFSKNVEVKGKITYSSTDGEYKTVSLDPCEVKK